MRFPHFCCIALILAGVGCGRSNVAPVSGKVTLNNKPLVNATVIFQPDSGETNPGPGSQGKTDKNGEFTLELMTGGKGAILGKHKVTITAYEGDDDEVPSSAGDTPFRKALVPAEYNVNTKLTFTVPAAGSTDANFNLKSDGK